MSNKNTPLRWLRHNRAALSLSRFGQYLEVTPESLRAYVEGSRIPTNEKHRITDRLQALLQAPNHPILDYALELLAEHRRSMAWWHAQPDMPKTRGEQRKIDIENAKNEQRFQDLTQLYAVLLRANPDCASFLASQLIEFNACVVEGTRKIVLGRTTGVERQWN